jgi:hypothetical protein
MSYVALKDGASLRVRTPFTDEFDLLVYETFDSLRSAAWALAGREAIDHGGEAADHLPAACQALGGALRGLRLYQFDPGGLCFTRSTGRLVRLLVDGRNVATEVTDGVRLDQSIGAVAQSVATMTFAAGASLQAVPPPQGAAYQQLAAWVAARGVAPTAQALTPALDHTVQAYRLLQWEPAYGGAGAAFRATTMNTLTVYFGAHRRVLTSR